MSPSEERSDIIGASWRDPVALFPLAFVRQELRRLRTLVQTLEEKRDEDRVGAKCNEADDDDDSGEEEEEGHEQPKADLETCTIERKTQSEVWNLAECRCAGSDSVVPKRRLS